MKLPPVSILLLLTPLVFNSCRSTGTTASSGGSGSSTPGHNMSHQDYPFDENGNYREDWARGEDNGKVVDLTKDNPPSVFTGTQDARDEEPPAKKSTASSKPKSGSVAKETSKPGKPKVVAKPKPQSTTVTVKKGDTLYALATRYGTTVKAIQAANGMGSSTLLRDGRTLKIPR